MQPRCHRCNQQFLHFNSATSAIGHSPSWGRVNSPRLSPQRSLPFKLAKVYTPCALVAKKTELMEGAGETHGSGPRREGDIADWPVRVLCGLEYCKQGILACSGAVALLEEHEQPDVGWH